MGVGGGGSEKGQKRLTYYLNGPIEELHKRNIKLFILHFSPEDLSEHGRCQKTFEKKLQVTVVQIAFWAIKSQTNFFYYHIRFNLASIFFH